MPTSPATPTNTASVMQNYLHAKDENRPVYMARVFAPNAALEMTLRTPAIAFPSHAYGRDAITETLVRSFGQTYENVFTFYLGHPGANAKLNMYTCDWFVGMAEKATGHVRIGCGHYDWEFQAEPHLAIRLTITIETMLNLTPDTAPTIFSWITALPYPWTDAQHVVQTAPPIEALAPVMQWLRRDHPIDPTGGTA